MEKAMERIQYFQDCVGRHDNDGDYDDNVIEWFWLPIGDVCAEEEVIVLPAGEEDAMFGPGSLVPPSYKLSKNSKRNIRLLQMADPRCFK